MTRTLADAARLQVPVSGGVTLAALRLANEMAPAPAVVVLTPYRKESFVAGTFARIGLDQLACHVIVADVRGVGGSGGEWEGPLSPREISDGVELLEWVAAQEFCNGRTALVGPSYHGLNNLLIAARRPRGLSCIVSIVPAIDVYRDMWRRGGIPSHTNWGAAVAYSNEHRPDAQRRILDEFYLTTLGDPFDGERFRSRSAEDHLDQIDVPVLLIGGWYDYFLRGTIRSFRRLRSRKRLVVGNWGHSPDSTEVRQEVVGWINYWASGIGSDPTARDNVLLQTVNTGSWKTHRTWPGPSEIAWERWQPLAAPASVPVALVLEASESDPPVPALEHVGTNSGMGLWRETWTTTTRPVETRTAYRGPVALKAVLTSEEASDLDLHARLSIVRGDGTTQQVTEGRLRASHRAVDKERSELTPDGDICIPWHPHDTSAAILPGAPTTLEVEIFPINLELAPGESLQLGITLVRVDAAVEPAHVTLLPGTRLLLPHKHLMRVL